MWASAVSAGYFLEVREKPQRLQTVMAPSEQGLSLLMVRSWNHANYPKGVGEHRRASSETGPELGIGCESCSAPGHPPLSSASFFSESLDSAKTRICSLAVSLLPGKSPLEGSWA